MSLTSPATYGPLTEQFAAALIFMWQRKGQDVLTDEGIKTLERQLTSLDFDPATVTMWRDELQQWLVKTL